VRPTPRLAPPPVAPGPGRGPVARADAVWTFARAPVRRAVRALDAVAVVAWALLAVILLALTVGPTLGAFEVGQGTPQAPAVRPVPAQAPHWQEPARSTP
jgi:hypothetical protein